MTTNLLLVDSSIPDYQVFVTSVNSSTIPVLYSNTTTRTEILTQLSAYTSIDRIGIAFSNNGYNIFLENDMFFGDNMNFIISLIQEKNVKNIDYLACNTLNSSTWVQYYNTITEQTGVIVGASNNASGNIQYGGDWVLESTGQDIEFIYFTQSIEYYKYLLDPTSTHTIVLKTNTLYGTGHNVQGQLGLGDNTDKNTLELITTSKTPASISKGYRFTVVVMTDGTVYGTGLNDQGQLGLGNTTNVNTLQPMTMPNLKQARAAFCGFAHTIVLMTDGTLYGTGRNDQGQLGLSGNQTTLQPITCPNTPFWCACGGTHTIVLMTDGTVYSTGRNLEGQLGLGNNTGVGTLQPITLPNLKKASVVSCGELYTVVMMTDGTLYSTGLNDNGQLGLGDNSNRNTLQLITSPAICKMVVCGNNFTITLMTNNTIYGTGLNSSGQLGLGNNTSTNTLQQMTTPNTPAYIDCGLRNTIVLMTDNTLYGTGGNSNGQLGLGNTTNVNTLQPFLNGSNITKLADTVTPYIVNVPSNVVCFKEGSLILTDKGYLPIEQLQKGALVRTLLHGFVPIDMIGKRDIYHAASNDRNKNQLYICTSDVYPEVFEPLVITGCHSILIDEFIDGQRELVNAFNGGIYITDNQYRLPACVDPRAKVYDKQGNYTIYHIALENNDYYLNYGIYANGLLVETCSKRYLKELSNMEII